MAWLHPTDLHSDKRWGRKDEEKDKDHSNWNRETIVNAQQNKVAPFKI